MFHRVMRCLAVFTALISFSNAFCLSGTQHKHKGVRLRLMANAASNPFAEEMKLTAKKIAGRGRGILASDESNATTGKRLMSVGA
jgi:hypothetical protein